MRLVCPNCGSDDLARIEVQIGFWEGTFRDSQGGIAFDPSDEPTDWEPADSIGIVCNPCGWSAGMPDRIEDDAFQSATSQLVTQEEWEADHPPCDDCATNGLDCATHGEAFRLARQAILADPSLVLRALGHAGFGDG